MKGAQLPSIDREQRASSSGNYRNITLAENENNLPLISNNSKDSFITHKQSVPLEKKVIIKNSSIINDDENADVVFISEEDKVNKNDDNNDLVKSKLQWENQIARHILTLFAHTNSTIKNSEKKTLLEFVDDPTEEELQQIADLKKGIPPISAKINYDDEDQKNNLDSTKKTRKKKKNKKNVISSSNEQISETNSELQYFEEILRKIEIEQKEKGDEYGNKHRVTNTIKTKNGQDIVVRGQAKCFPIWFVSTGEVYSDWTKLDGGEKLQSQLNILYENQQYEEYLGVIEQLLVVEWKEFLYGKTDFTVGSFGISSHAPPITLSKKTKSNKSLTNKSSNNTTMKSKFEDTDTSNFGEPLQWQKSGLVSKINQIIESREANSSEEKHKPKWTREELIELWRQLISTGVAFGILAVEKKNFVEALKLLQKAEACCLQEEFLPDKSIRRELRAYCCDAISYYFFRKGKALASLSYAKMALEAYEVSQNIDGIATALLHIAAGYGQLGEHKTAHKKLFEFLAMVETGRLAFAESTPKQICLVAIGYHNLAVVQLKLQMPDLACKNSQNARKLARLCLSYSNRYIHVFQYTHEIAIGDIKWELSLKKAKDLTPDQMVLIKELSEALFETPDDI